MLQDTLKETLHRLGRKEGVEYADVRLVRRAREGIKMKNGRVDHIHQAEDQGYGVRVLYKGAWGFASTNRLEDADAGRIFDLALDIARSSASIAKERVVMSPVEPVVDDYSSPCEIDPFQVPLDEKISLLDRAMAPLMKAPEVKVAESSVSFYRTESLFISTEGSVINQKVIESGGGINVVAVRGGEPQARSYPNSFSGNTAARGYEFVRDLGLENEGERAREEAVALLSAPPCPHGRMTLIVASDQLGLQVHESCGHPVELDRVLGSEISLAGGSFLKVADAGKLRYGSERVNIVADSTVPGGLGTFGYDDEGVEAGKTDIVREGILMNFLTSRETAGSLGMESNGAMRADGWSRIPLIRMTNINLEPGEWPLEEMILDTDHGIMVSTNKSWSIDDRRLNFQFGTQIAWEISHGKITRMLKNPIYTGITPDFWSRCDAVGDAGSWRLWGIPSCGKGEPMQVCHVGHGASPARFRDVEVGVAK
jgi:TldD protein